MAEIIEGQIQVETLPDDPKQTSQPGSVTPDSILDDDAAVRAAIIAAEQRGEDPTNVKIGDVVQGSKPVDVPEKFKTPTGEVDVEKLKASTKQLDEAIQKKETEVQKTVEEYVAEYRAKEAKFRSMPNPERLAQGLQTAQPPVQESVQQLPPDQLKQKIAQDLNADPVGTTVDLIDIMVAKRMAEKLAPIEQDIQQTRIQRENERIKENIKQIASKDARVLNPQVFAAINAKLDADPDLWKLKNPHKAAWLEVKEEMRLGEPSQVQAQPSRPTSPILGGGTPPPPQSQTSGVINSQTIASALNQVDYRDKNQMDALEKAAKEYFDREFKARR